MNRQTASAVAVACVALFTVTPERALSAPHPVKTASGLVAGVAGRNAAITVFKGIPFAAPPVGALRWHAPEPPAPWQGVHQADAFSPNCIQTIVTEKSPGPTEFMAHGEVGEDCLYLNGWTPAAGSPNGRPVFVYIYGGANVEGSGSIPAYDGEGLASKGLVVVTFNYRVGVRSSDPAQRPGASAGSITAAIPSTILPGLACCRFASTTIDRSPRSKRA